MDKALFIGETAIRMLSLDMVRQRALGDYMRLARLARWYA